MSAPRWARPTPNATGERSGTCAGRGTTERHALDRRPPERTAPDRPRTRWTVVRATVAALALAVVAAGCTLPGRASGPLTITAVFDDVGDLAVNHGVQQADVRIGSVTKIRLGDDFKAEVTMSVRETGLRSDAVAELRTTSLLGEKFIALRNCTPEAPHHDTGCQPGAPPLTKGSRLHMTTSAPELEFVAETAVAVLGGVAIQNGVAPDLVTLVDTGATSLRDRGPELRSLIDDFATISSTLAGQVGNIATILDGLDATTATLAANDATMADLLTNLADASGVLVRSRDQAVATLAALTSVLEAQDELVFSPYLDQISRQVRQLDDIVGTVVAGRDQVSSLLAWLSKFLLSAPGAIPGDFAQVYGWSVVCPGPGC